VGTNDFLVNVNTTPFLSHTHTHTRCGHQIFTTYYSKYRAILLELLGRDLNRWRVLQLSFWNKTSTPTWFCFSNDRLGMLHVWIPSRLMENVLSIKVWYFIALSLEDMVDTSFFLLNWRSCTACSSSKSYLIEHFELWRC